MKFFPASGLACALLMFHLSGAATPDGSKSDGTLFGFRDASQELKAETRFLAVPDPKLAEEHLRVLTQAPHIAGSPEDKATADYVASEISRSRTRHRNRRIQSVVQLSRPNSASMPPRPRA